MTPWLRARYVAASGFLSLVRTLLTPLLQALTGDLGGKAKTHEYAEAIMKHL